MHEQCEGTIITAESVIDASQQFGRLNLLLPVAIAPGPKVGDTREPAQRPCKRDGAHGERDHRKEHGLLQNHRATHARLCGADCSLTGRAA